MSGTSLREDDSLQHLILLRSASMLLQKQFIGTVGVECLSDDRRP